MNHNRESVLRMTPNEEAALKLLRSGMSYRQIAIALGHDITRGRGLNVLQRAVEKERLMALDDRRGRQETSLKRAHGYATQKGKPI